MPIKTPPRSVKKLLTATEKNAERCMNRHVLLLGLGHQFKYRLHPIISDLENIGGKVSSKARQSRL
jgi:hypothetical protein